MATSSTTPQLSDEQLVELLTLVREADSVELKLTVEAAAHRGAVGALGLDPLDAQIRQVFFFDTPALDLEARGVVVRARRVQGKGDDSVVKLRPVDPPNLSPELRASPNFVVEVDAMPGGYVCSGSMKGQPKSAVRDVVGGGKSLRKLFSAEQRAFYAEHAPEGLALEDLSVLGPVFVLKLKGQPPGFGRKLVGEMWLYPDGTRIVELSTKCAPAEAFQVAAESRAYLAERGISAAGGQQTKTRKALSFFADQLGEAPVDV